MSESTTNAILAGIVITFVTVSVLIGIIIKQKQKIDDYEKPRFGFLGKKLSAYLLGTISLGVLGVIAFPWNYATPDSSISVSDKEIEAVQIEYELINVETNEYLLTAVPIVSGMPWTERGNIVDIGWFLDGEFVAQETISVDINEGITLKLDNPTNTVRVTIFLRGKEVTNEITINLDLE